MKPLLWSPLAERDVADAAYWYANEGGVALGEEFLVRVDACLELIGRFPQTGSSAHAGLFPDLPVPLRFLLLKRFDRYLVYYLDLPGRIVVVRVWNASRGLDALMGEHD